MSFVGLSENYPQWPYHALLTGNISPTACIATAQNPIITRVFCGFVRTVTAVPLPVGGRCSHAARPDQRGQGTVHEVSLSLTAQPLRRDPYSRKLKAASMVLGMVVDLTMVQVCASGSQFGRLSHLASYDCFRLNVDLPTTLLEPQGMTTWKKRLSSGSLVSGRCLVVCFHWCRASW